MQSNSTIHYRNFNPQSDFTALLRLLEAAKEADQSNEDVSEETQREWLDLFAQEPEEARRVACAADELVGYGFVLKAPLDKEADLAVTVHPAWRGSGIGSRLLADLEQHARSRGATFARAYADVRHQEANRFLRQRGYEPVSTYTRLNIAADTPFPQPTFPEGFVLKPYEQVQDVDVLLEAVNRGYEGLWGHHTIRREELAERLPEQDTAGRLLLFAPDGHVVGLTWAKLKQPSGLIDAPGVVPEYRTAGLYLPLTLAALTWLQERGATSIDLESWGDAPETIDLYRTLGFVTVQEELSYQHSLGAGTAL